MIPALRLLIRLAVLAICLVAAATWLPPYFNRVQVPPDYEDLAGLTPMSTVWLSPPPYAVGDGVAYRTGERPEDIGFGLIAALPGDAVRLVAGELQVNGKPAANWHESGLYRGIREIGPLIVPARHLYVISKQHQRDSLTLGVIGPDRLLGKVRE